MALSAFNIIGISQDIAERNVNLRQEFGLKRPEAIVLATAQSIVMRWSRGIQGFRRYTRCRHALSILKNAGQAQALPDVLFTPLRPGIRTG